MIKKMCITTALGIMAFSFFSVSTLHANAIVYQSDAGLNQGMAKLGEAIGRAFGKNAEKKKQKELEKTQILLYIACELMEKKNAEGALSEQDINQAALKYSIATSTKQKDSLKIIKEVVALM